MRGSLFHKLIILLIIMDHLAINCDASVFPRPPCQSGGFGPYRSHWSCNPRRLYQHDPCYNENFFCDSHHSLSDCLLPLFFCVNNFRCIPRRHLCNGIPDCSDGSDEWECDTPSVYTTTSVIRSDSTEYISLITDASTIIRDDKEYTTREFFPESEENSSSSSTTTTMLPHSEANAFLSSSTTANILYSEPNNVLSSSATTTMLPHSKISSILSSSTTISTLGSYSGSNSVLSSSTTTISIKFLKSELNNGNSSPATSTFVSDPESKTVLPSSTISNTMFPDFESETSFLSSAINAMITEIASNTPLSSSIKKTLLSTSESNVPLSTVVDITTSTQPSSEKIDSSTINTIFAKSSAMQSCPDNYCMQNAECIIAQGQYRCKCPPSFIGELCEIQLGTGERSYDYSVVIAVSVTLVIVFLAVISACTYRYKRSSSWKFKDGASRTLSQLTLASHAIE